MKVHQCDKETNQFTIILLIEHRTEFVEIHETSMDGWRLYECFFLPSFEVQYFGWDENAAEPEWINLADEKKTEKVSVLCQELVKYKGLAA